MIRKVIAIGYCERCQRIRIGYKNEFMLLPNSLILFAIYLTLDRFFPAWHNQIVDVLLIALYIEIGISFYMKHSGDPKCLNCNGRLNIKDYKIN